MLRISRSSRPSREGNLRFDKLSDHFIPPSWREWTLFRDLKRDLSIGIRLFRIGDQFADTFWQECFAYPVPLVIALAPMRKDLTAKTCGLRRVIADLIRNLVFERIDTSGINARWLVVARHDEKDEESEAPSLERIDASASTRE